VPSGATSTMLIEPSTRPSGAVIQSVSVRYGFGAVSGEQASRPSDASPPAK
jgi:hypothetical protein